MIDVYSWPTGNGKKITLMLEECGLPYNVIPVNINKGDQSMPAYDAINPNNRMPASIDHEAVGGPMRRRTTTSPAPTRSQTSRHGPGSSATTGRGRT